MLTATKTGLLLFVLALGVASCSSASEVPATGEQEPVSQEEVSETETATSQSSDDQQDDGGGEANETSPDPSVTEEENAREFTVDVEASGSVGFGVDGSAVVTGSVRAPDKKAVSQATVTYMLSDGVSVVGMSAECVQEGQLIVCSLVRDLRSESNSTVGTESFVTELELLVDADAVDPSVTVSGSSYENPVSNDPNPDNNVVVLDLADAIGS